MCLDPVHRCTAQNIGENSSQLFPTMSDQCDPETVPSPETGVKYPCQCPCLSIVALISIPRIFTIDHLKFRGLWRFISIISLTLSVGLAHLDAHAYMYHAKSHRHLSVVSARFPGVKIPIIGTNLIDGTPSGQARSSAEPARCSAFRALSIVIIY